VLDDDGLETLWCMAWMAVYGERTSFVADLVASQDCKSHSLDKHPKVGLSKTGAFLLPISLGKLIKEGMELGDADDKVFGRVNSKHGSGTVGVLTDGLIDRSEYYEHALVLALIPWIRPDVYPAKA
jgi:non-canonical (house-cleaning) NTP pyrophosphatase